MAGNLWTTMLKNRILYTKQGVEPIDSLLEGVLKGVDSSPGFWYEPRASVQSLFPYASLDRLHFHCLWGDG